MPPATEPPLVVIADDDAAVRRALQLTVELDGFRAMTCASVEALLGLDLPMYAACLVIDERLSGLSGLRALSMLRRRGCRLPAALITSHPSPRLRAAAADARVPILEKPLLEDGLITWIRAAVSR